MKNIVLLLCVLWALTGCEQPPTNESWLSELSTAQMTNFKCEFSYDSNGHTHIRAEAEDEMFFCMGYVHAKDRLWQMDHFRRISQGRTAEYLGKDKIKVDFMARLLKVYQKSRDLYLGLQPELQDRLKAYAVGVNKFIDETKEQLPYEYKELGLKPEKWHPVDTIALILLQSFDQTRATFLDEVEDQKLLGTDREKELLPENGVPWDTSILKDHELTTQAKAPTSQSIPSSVAKENLEELKEMLGSRDDFEGIGSNNWVLSPARTKSKFAMMANDPHLSLRHPPFWYWISIEDKQNKAMGVTFPGIPFIPSGFNKNVSWGLTNAYLDSGRISQISTDRLSKNVSFRPLVWLKWWKLQIPVFYKSFERTPDGMPVMPFESPQGTATVLYWTGFDITSEQIASVFNLWKVQSTADATDVIKKFDVSSWNFVFADVAGNIGFVATGNLIKNKTPLHLGITEVPHSDPIKPEFVEKKLQPELQNPFRGFIVTANNRHWPASYGVQSGTSVRAGFRAYRVEKLLQQLPKHDVETLKKVQCDVYAVDAEFILPYLIGSIDADANSKTVLKEIDLRALNLLKSWNYSTDTQCKACGVYRRWVQLLFDHYKVKEVGLYKLVTDKDFKSELPTVLKLFSQSVTDTVKNDDFPMWGDIHRAPFKHVTDHPALAIRSELTLATGGDRNSINPGTFDYVNGMYEHRAGASQRLIVEMSSPPKAYVQLTGPNRDLMRGTPEVEAEYKKWSECNYSPVQFEYAWKTVSVLEN